MKHIKLYEVTMQEEMANDKIEKELSEAFFRVLLNGMRIDFKDITSVDAYNKYTIITTKNAKIRIDYDNSFL